MIVLVGLLGFVVGALVVIVWYLIAMSRFVSQAHARVDMIDTLLDQTFGKEDTKLSAAPPPPGDVVPLDARRGDRYPDNP